MFFAIHSVAMVLFAFNQPPPTGPNANANSLIWVCWVWVDFPLGFLSLYFAHSLFPESSFGSIATYFLVGGLQWFVWGILFQFIVKMLTTSKQINNN